MPNRPRLLLVAACLLLLTGPLWGQHSLTSPLLNELPLARTGTPRPLLLTTPPGGAGPYWDQGGGQPDRQPVKGVPLGTLGRG